MDFHQILSSAHKDTHPDAQPFSATFWAYAGVSLGIVGFAGMMAGMTMGFVSLDPTYVEIVLRTGTQQQQKWARRVRPFVQRHHLTLVTLLLGNSLANEALPIFLDKIVNEYVAIVLSVSFVLIFGEILPSAIFTGPNQLRIAAGLSWFMWGLLILFYPISKPISWILDKWLGHDHGLRFQRAELKEFVRLHSATAEQQAAAVLEERLDQGDEHGHTPSSIVEYVERYDTGYGPLRSTYKSPQEQTIYEHPNEEEETYIVEANGEITTHRPARPGLPPAISVRRQITTSTGTSESAQVIVPTTPLLRSGDVGSSASDTSNLKTIENDAITQSEDESILSDIPTISQGRRKAGGSIRRAQSLTHVDRARSGWRTRGWKSDRSRGTQGKQQGQLNQKSKYGHTFGIHRIPNRGQHIRESLAHLGAHAARYLADHQGNKPRSRKTKPERSFSINSSLRASPKDKGKSLHTGGNGPVTTDNGEPAAERLAGMLLLAKANPEQTQKRHHGHHHKSRTQKAATNGQNKQSAAAPPRSPKVQFADMQSNTLERPLLNENEQDSESKLSQKRKNRGWRWWKRSSSVSSSSSSDSNDDTTNQTQSTKATAAQMESHMLTADEVTIIAGTLDLKDKTVGSRMIPRDQTFMLSTKDTLNDEALTRIMCSTHSRIPVFVDDDRNAIVGILFVKLLLRVNPEDGIQVSRVPLGRPLVMHPDTPMFDALNMFQTGRCHMAIISEQAEELQRCLNLGILHDTNKVQVLGIITLENVIEELIQEPIEDETDVMALTGEIRDMPYQRYIQSEISKSPVKNIPTSISHDASGDITPMSVATVDIFPVSSTRKNPYRPHEMPRGNGGPATTPMMTISPSTEIKNTEDKNKE